MKEDALSERVRGDGPKSHQLVNTGHRYQTAPIIEASIDLRVSLPAEVSLDELAAVFASDSDVVTDPDPFYSFSPGLTVDAGDEIVGTTSGTQLGYTFKSNDGSFVMRSNLDRFAYSRLGQYTEWSDFLAEVEPKWESYKVAIAPTDITSVGVRFVNRIDVMKPQIEIKDYLRTSIDVSPYLPQAISGYFAQVGIPLQDYEAHANVTTAILDSDEPDTTSLILDIDVTRAVTLSLGSPAFEDELLATLAQLREAKNFVFEACITDATRGLMS